MYERHENEQYFFDQATIGTLASFVAQYQSVCCLCTPMLAKNLNHNSLDVTVLDKDQRFSDIPGFRDYNLYEPEWIDKAFDLIICDPPFFNVSLSQLFKAIRMLSHNNLQQPLMISYLKRRGSAITGTFAAFDLKPSGYFPGYQTVQSCDRNQIEFFTNLSDVILAPLQTGPEVT